MYVVEVKILKKYRNTIEFEVYGPYALFSDPVMRVGGEKIIKSVGMDMVKLEKYEVRKPVIISQHMRR